MSNEIHPAPQEFGADEIAADAILRFFHYAHLPAVLQARSKPFCDNASDPGSHFDPKPTLV